MAMIFLSITLLFIICHSPRLILDIHELITSDYAKRCKMIGIRYLPNVWTFVMIYIRDHSHITLSLFREFLYNHQDQMRQHINTKGASINYVDKQGEGRVSRMSTMLRSRVFHYIQWCAKSLRMHGQFGQDLPLGINDSPKL